MERAWRNFRRRRCCALCPGYGFVAPVSAAPPGEIYRHAGRTTETQKAHPAGWALHLFDAWQFPTLTWGDPTLPSALRRFTSEFGMGSGGTTALVPPGKFFVLSTQFFIASAALPALVKSVTYFSMLLPFRRLSPCCCANYCVLNSESKLKILSNPPKHLRRCKVKPHGSLVPVSSTHRCAYTPGLSTSSSSTFLQET